MNHKEAFCLMRYASKDNAVVEYLWNSRDGVTPFGIKAKDGQTDLLHVDWNRDECRPAHKLMPGDRFFRSMEKRDVSRILENRMRHVPADMPKAERAALEQRLGESIEQEVGRAPIVDVQP